MRVFLVDDEFFAESVSEKKQLTGIVWVWKYAEKQKTEKKH